MTLRPSRIVCATWSTEPTRNREACWLSADMQYGGPRLSTVLRVLEETVEQCMSVIATTIHHHPLRSRFRHSATRSVESLPLRVARLIADLTNGTLQHPPT
jgi:hypothetical protein